MQKKILIAFICLTFLVSIISLIFSLSDIRASNVKFDIDRFLAITGVFVSLVAFLIGAYFAFLAVNAYAHVKEFEKYSAILKRQFNDFSIESIHLNNTLKSSALMMKREIDYQIRLTIEWSSIFNRYSGNSKIQKINESRKKELYLRRARMGYELPILDLDLRIKLINELAALGDERDIIELGKISKENCEPPELQFCINETIKHLKKKLRT